MTDKPNPFLPARRGSSEVQQYGSALPAPRNKTEAKIVTQTRADVMAEMAQGVKARVAHDIIDASVTHQSHLMTNTIQRLANDRNGIQDEQAQAAYDEAVLPQLVTQYTRGMMTIGYTLSERLGEIVARPIDAHVPEEKRGFIRRIIEG